MLSPILTSFSNCYEVADYFEKNIDQITGERLRTHILRYINYLRNNKLEDETQILYTLNDFETRLEFGNKLCQEMPGAKVNKL